VEVLKPRLLDELLEDENPPDELVDEIPEDIENADPHQIVRRSMHTPPHTQLNNCRLISLKVTCLV
jgi:hypothetical protein